MWRLLHDTRGASKDEKTCGHLGLTHCLCLPSQFRLKRCGLGHRVYLVEEYGSVHNLSLPESTLLQAVTNTQVRGGGGGPGWPEIL